MKDYDGKMNLETLKRKAEVLDIFMDQKDHIITLHKKGKKGTVWIEDGIIELACNIKNVNSTTQLLKYLK